LVEHWRRQGDSVSAVEQLLCCYAATDLVLLLKRTGLPFAALEPGGKVDETAASSLTRRHCFTLDHELRRDAHLNALILRVPFFNRLAHFGPPRRWTDCSRGTGTLDLAITVEFIADRKRWGLGLGRLNDLQQIDLAKPINDPRSGIDAGRAVGHKRGSNRHGCANNFGPLVLRWTNEEDV
jgi:hypothetical protein